jgi:hypothetical protein
MTIMMRCDQFDELLPDLLEETLSPDARQTAEAHLRSCVRCTGLVGDIAGIRAEAAALAPLRPSRDLWSGIASRIEAPVVEIGGRTPAVAPRRLNRAWLAAAAVALMAISSGTTWVLTPRFAADSTRVATAPAGPSVPAVPQNDKPAVPETVALDGDASISRAPAGKGVMRNVTSARRRPVAPTLEQTYEREVVALRRILTERSDALDPRTVAILEASLKMIDQAILQSREALAADPASGFLRDQLNKALDRKVEVLRTAAMLPART